MKYTPDEKKRMDRLLEIFGEYLASNEDIDVAYSDKSGYVRLILASNADNVFFPIESYDNLLEMFFFDILCDEVSFALARNGDLTNAEMDYPGVFLRLCGYIWKLGEDRDYALARLKKFVRKWKESDLLP